MKKIKNIFEVELPRGNAEIAQIRFELVNMGGLDEMHNYSTDSRLYEYLEFEPFQNKNTTKAYLKKLIGRMKENSDKPTSCYWFVRRIKDNRMIGTAGLTNLDYSRGSIEWGYGLDPDLWGNGYILQIQEFLKKYVFETLGLNRIDGITMVKNKRTIEALLATGMVHEGVASEYFCKNNKFIDGWRYGMTKAIYDKSLKSTELRFSSKDTKKLVLSMISKVFIDEDITENSSMADTFSWDSLGHMEVVVRLKEDIGLDLSPSEIASATSVKSIIEIIDNKRSGFGE